MRKGVHGQSSQSCRTTLWALSVNVLAFPSVFQALHRNWRLILTSEEFISYKEKRLPVSMVALPMTAINPGSLKYSLRNGTYSPKSSKNAVAAFYPYLSLTLIVNDRSPVCNATSVPILISLENSQRLRSKPCIWPLSTLLSNPGEWN